jgi:hypothetical protein
MRRVRILKASLLAAVVSCCAAAAAAAAGAPPALVTAPASLRFGSAAAVRWVTFTNNGSSPVVLGPVAIAWRGQASFALRGDTCTGEIVALRPGESCKVGVVFAPPKRAGRFRARLMYATGDRLEHVALSGGAG